MLLLLMACPDETPPPTVDSDAQPIDTEVEQVVVADEPTLRVNELMASNAGAHADASGAFPDWLELVNVGDEPVTLDGWTLQVGEDTVELEELVVEPGGFAVLYLDGSGALGPAHLDLRLPSEGGSLVLRDPFQATSDALEWPQQATDIAAARVPDAAAGWSLTSTPTPGSANEGPTPDPDAQGAAGDCGLSPLGETRFLEGELVELTLACEDNPDAELLGVLLPQGAAHANGSLTWQTGATDGGRHDLVFATRDPGAIESIPAAAVRTLWVADEPSLGSPPDPLAYTEEWGLPVFHVQTGLEDIPQDYVAATITYRGVEYAAAIKVRGASSTSYPKKSYTLAFEEQELVVEDWPWTRDRLVLVTTFDDNSYVRTKLVFDQWAAMAEHAGQARLTPRTYFAVLYLDGAYHGLYTAADHVDDEFLEQMGFTRDANLYKAVNHDANFYLKSNLHAGYEKKEGEPVDDYSDLDELIAFTGGSAPADLVAGAGQWLDLEEFMDWFLLVHYSEAADSAGKNSYLYNDPRGDFGFRFAPWDFNHSWGQNWYTARVGSDALNDFSNRNAVFAAIHSQRSEELWERFADLRAEGGPMSTEWLLARLDEYYTLIDPSAERDWAKWEGEYRAFGRWRDHRNAYGDWQDYEGEKAYLRAWIEARGALFEALHPEDEGP